jgi:surface carbohydrate biosynthesis protein (TIGR04326 family)
MRQHFMLRDGLSAWDLSVIAERNLWRCPAIIDVLRLWALTDLVVRRAVTSIELHSGNQAIADCLGPWCRRQGIVFVHHEPAQHEPRFCIRRAIPHRLRAVLWLARRLMSCWPLVGAGKSRWNAEPSDACVVSYVTSAGTSATGLKNFTSPYWPGIERALGDGERIAWIHRLPDDFGPASAKSVAREIHALNALTGSHVTIESFLSIPVVASTIRDFMTTTRRARRAGEAWIRDDASGLDLRPLLRSDWRRSVHGAALMEQCLYLNLLEHIFRGKKQPRCCLYPLENCAWERALLHAWRTAGRSPIVGVQHSTVRFWDLRYFEVPSGSQRDDEGDPDIFAINGPLARRTLATGDTERSVMFEVEALRYNHLVKGGDSREPKPERPRLRILVLADFEPMVTQTMIEAVVAAAAGQWDIVLRRHPTGGVAPIPPYIQLSAGTLQDALSEATLVVSSPTTSALIDCLGACVPVVVMRNPCTLDLNPLRDLPGLKSATTSEELRTWVNAAAAGMLEWQPSLDSLLNLDPALPRWRQLLSSVTQKDPSTAKRCVESPKPPR